MRNKNGAALLMVIFVMFIVLILTNILIRIVTQERIQANQYENRNQAFYVAEAAADLAINRWIDFINSTHNNSSNTLCPNKADISVYINNYLDNNFDVDGNARYDLEKSLKDTLGVNDITINYTYRPDTLHSGSIYDKHYIEGNPLFSAYESVYIDIAASYMGQTYPYQLKLGYCNHGKIFYYKGGGSW